MRRSASYLTLLLALGVALPAHADRGGFVIESFHTDLEVESNSNLVVEERIEVRFLEPRHGLYRTIPVRYTDPRGYAYSLGFRLLHVRDQEGRPHDVKVSHKGRYINVRMGDADRTVSGIVVYRLRYRIARALGHFPEFDEIYWNAVGHEFQAPILRASANVRLPEAFGSEDLQVAAYSGRFGSTGRDVEIAFPEPGVVAFAATRSLNPLEGLTVAVGWPKGAVDVPGPLDRLARFLAANWVIFFPFAFLAWLWQRYRHRGRDPAGRASIVVRYEPPSGATPGEVGTVVDERVDMRDITATLVDLAVRGRLKISIEERSVLFGLIDSETIVFERQGEEEGDLLAHERKLLDGLFASGDRVELEDLTQKFYRHIPGIKDALQERMVEQGLFTAKANSVRQRFAAGGLVAGLVVFLVGLAWVKLSGGVLPHGLVVPILAGVLTALAGLCFAPAMPQRTRKGVDLKGWALGFEEFVDRVETERLEADRRRNVFESLLPYAMALGVAAAWARRFEDIYEREGPEWFTGGDSSRGFSTTRFESDLNTAMSKTASTLASAPRSSGSSGSGGGGSSGGGGGGGGGGSW